MRKILSLCIALCCCVLAGADESLDAFLAYVKGKRLEFRYEYTVNSGKKNEFHGNGTLIFQDGAFKYDDGKVKMYNDTQTFWSVDAAAREITIEPGITMYAGDSFDTVLRCLGINPKGSTIRTLLTSDGSPRGFEIKLKDRTVVEVEFNAIKLMQAGQLSDFSLDLSKPDRSLKTDPSWVITDLR